MPPNMRALLTCLVVVLAIALWLGRSHIGLAASPVLFFGLALGICAAIWMFPETRKNDQR